MGLVKCVVPGCEDRTSPRHRIPVLDQELYEEWLERIGNEELKSLDPQFVGSNKRICSVHFSSHCRIPNSTKLKNRSLPTLHLPGFKLEPSLENSILKYSELRTPHNGFVKDERRDIVGIKKNKLQSFISSPSLKVRCHGINNHCQRYKQCADSDKLIQNPRPTISAFRQKGRRSLQSFQGSGNGWKRVAVQLSPLNESAGSPYKGERCEVPTNIDFTYLIKIDSSLPEDSLFPPLSDEICSPIFESSNFPPLTSDVSQSSLYETSTFSALTSDMSQSSLYEGFEELSNTFPTVDLEELIRERCKSLLPETPSANSLCHEVNSY